MEPIINSRFRWCGKELRSYIHYIFHRTPCHFHLIGSGVLECGSQSVEKGAKAPGYHLQALPSPVPFSWPQPSRGRVHCTGGPCNRPVGMSGHRRPLVPTIELKFEDVTTLDGRVNSPLPPSVQRQQSAGGAFSDHTILPVPATERVTLFTFW